MRDNVLDGVEDDVLDKVMDHVRRAMSVSVRDGIEAAADKRLKRIAGGTPLEVTDGKG